MLFTDDAVPGLADGSITLTFRTWKKPQARVGGRYKVAGLLLQVDAVSLVDPASIIDAEARRAGNPSAEAARDRLDKQGHSGRVWRVQFRCVGADPASPSATTRSMPKSLRSSRSVWIAWTAPAVPDRGQHRRCNSSRHIPASYRQFSRNA